MRCGKLLSSESEGEVVEIQAQHRCNGLNFLRRMLCFMAPFGGPFPRKAYIQPHLEKVRWSPQKPQLFAQVSMHFVLALPFFCRRLFNITIIFENLSQTLEFEIERFRPSNPFSPTIFALSEALTFPPCPNTPLAGMVSYFPQTPPLAADSSSTPLVSFEPLQSPSIVKLRAADSVRFSQGPPPHSPKHPSTCGANVDVICAGMVGVSSSTSSRRELIL